MSIPYPLALVTGALGWLGSRTVETLCQGIPGDSRFPEPDPRIPIRCLVLPGQDTTALKNLSANVEIVTGDITNPADCQRFCAGARNAVLFHTAGIIHPRRVTDFYRVNTMGTAHLLDAASAAGIKRAVVVSSNSPCGCNPHPDHLFDELSPYHPYLNYGRSKMQMELQALERSRAGEIEVILLRAPWFYGPNQPPRQSLFFSMIRRGKAPIVGSGDNLRSMTYVDNLCQAMHLAAVAEGVNGRIFWIADRRPYTMNEIVNTVERVMESKFGLNCAHKRLRLPAFAGSAAWAVDATLQAAGLYHQKIHVLGEMHRTIACSVTCAERDLGYRPLIELEEGMTRSLTWCLNRGIKI